MATGTTFFLLNSVEPPPAPVLGGADEVEDVCFGGSSTSGRNGSDSASTVLSVAITSDGVSFSVTVDALDDGAARGGGLGAGGCAFALARIEKKKNTIKYFYTHEG